MGTMGAQTIEPSGALRSIEPAGGGGGYVTDSGGAGGDDFVISRRPIKGDSGDELAPLHLADEWWAFRAEFLQSNPAKVKERDDAISDSAPPPVFWDQQTAIEAASVWGELCNECHGGRRKLEDAIKMPPPPADWGRGTGLFFGQRRPYQELFRVVLNGGPIRNGQKSEMPAWQGRVSREEIWAILYFLEFQSGGIEGRFPPSLYPRSSDGR